MMITIKKLDNKIRNNKQITRIIKYQKYLHPNYLKMPHSNSMETIRQSLETQPNQKTLTSQRKIHIKIKMIKSIKWNYQIILITKTIKPIKNLINQMINPIIKMIKTNLLSTQIS